MYTITGGGQFSRTNINQINSNFSELQGAANAAPDIWVRPQYGNNNNVGSYDKPFATMAGASRAFEPGIVIGLQGVLKENFVAPLINDVTIVGLANQPRQATSSGIPNGGGATWMNPSTVASPLLHIGSSTMGTAKSQAWTVSNVFFGQAGVAANVIVDRGVGGNDASHAAFYGCAFTALGIAGGIGLSTGEIIRLIVDGCQFYDFTGAAAYGIRANIAGGIANPPYLQWQITNSLFTNNVNNLVGALRNATITGNSFMVLGRTQTTTVSIGLTGGANNTVMDNNIGDNLTGAAASYTGGTNDAWCNKYRDDGFGSGVPS
jgi:hypothetical protein